MNNRVAFIDWLKVISILMVLLVHSIEPFYLGGEGTFILNRGDALWCTLLDSALRAAVPLFVIASSYLLFPVTIPTGEFFRKRLSRVLIPFVLVSLLYAIYSGITSGDFVLGFKQLIFNFGNWGHLWFVYMLIGIYLIMPVLTPWVEKISKKEELIVILLWLFSTTIPFIRQASLSLLGTTDLWGEGSWNEFGTFYYISGFVGYLLLGHYFKKWVPELSWSKTLTYAIPLWLVGYGVTALWFWMKMPHDFPLEAPISLAVEMEIGWMFSTFGVALTVIGYFLVFRKIASEGWLYRHLILPISKAGYGIYLIHMFFLIYFGGLFRPLMGTGACIFCTAISTFIVSALISILTLILRLKASR